MNSDRPLPSLLSPRVSERRIRTSGFLSSLLLLCLSSGCGHEDGLQRNAISGTITLDGAPLKSGVVRLIPMEPRTGPGTMEKITDGAFQFTVENGPIAAQHRVEIEATEHVPFAIDDEAAFASFVKSTGRSPLARNPIPAIYNSASTLTASIENADDQKFVFELKSRP